MMAQNIKLSNENKLSFGGKQSAAQQRFTLKIKTWKKMYVIIA